VKLTTHLHLVLRSRMHGAIPPLSQYVFMSWCLVKHRHNFTFSCQVISGPCSKITSLVLDSCILKSCGVPFVFSLTILQLFVFCQAIKKSREEKKLFIYNLCSCPSISLVDSFTVAWIVVTSCATFCHSTSILS
jgi:hypothetical protein